MIDIKMTDQHRYALAMKVLFDIAEDDDTPIQVRVDISNALVKIHDHNMKIFEAYMEVKERLSRYEYYKD